MAVLRAFGSRLSAFVFPGLRDEVVSVYLAAARYLSEIQRCHQRVVEQLYCANRRSGSSMSIGENISVSEKNTSAK